MIAKRDRESGSVSFVGCDGLQIRIFSNLVQVRRSWAVCFGLRSFGGRCFLEGFLYPWVSRLYSDGVECGKSI